MPLPTSITKIIAQWQQEPTSFDATSWQYFYQVINPIPFMPAMLEVDEVLWGGFWQGDVLAPGYLMPALELAFLRVTRIDETLALPTPKAYLHYIQTHLQQIPIAAWLTVWQNKLVLSLAYNVDDAQQKQVVIWLVDGFIVAAYPETIIDSPGYDLQCLKPLPESTKGGTISPHYNPISVDALSLILPDWPAWSAAQRLDCWIRLHRTYSHLANQPERVPVTQVFQQLARHP